MHKIEECTGDAAREACMRRPPFGPGIDRRGVERVEIRGSAMDDPGPDYCEFRLWRPVANHCVHRITGY